MLFPVDEVDPTLDEMVQLAAFYQHFVREGRKVALLMAGLPHNISSLLNNKTVSFLRRSNRRALDRKRLIDAGIIGKRARGLVGFDLPYFRDYLQEKLDNGELLLEN